MQGYRLKFVAGALLAMGLAGQAAAECKISSAQRSGVIQNNDLVRFNTNLNGEKQYKATYDDKAWAGTAATVEPVGKCEGIVYHAKGAHVRIKSGQKGDVPADARGVGCSCK